MNSVEKLSLARKKLDVIDEQIANLFNERQKVAKEIAIIKNEANIATLDLAREEEIMKEAEERCGVYGRELFRVLMDLSKKEQMKYK